jgi:probable F420-dependent oxidoreductase
MQFALFGLHRGHSIHPETLSREARLAEEAGFEGLWVGDHVALPAKLGPSAEVPRLEALTALTYLAAVTSRVRLGIGVIVLPQRHPVLLAKQLTSIDILSNGRLTVGVGVGYIESELRALGASLSDRGARTDEYLAALRKLWQDPVPEFRGNFVSFSDVLERPFPIQRPHPPIVVGGLSAAAFKRAVTAGNGWYGWQLSPDETAKAIKGLEDAAGQYERPAQLGALEITITPPGPIDPDLVQQYADLGVSRLALQPQAMDEAAIPELIAMARERLIGRI